MLFPLVRRLGTFVPFWSLNRIPSTHILLNINCSIRYDAGINGPIILTGSECDNLTQTRCYIYIRIRRVATHISCSEACSRRLTKLHLILNARRQSGKLVTSICPCDRRSCSVVSSGTDQAICPTADQSNDLTTETYFTTVQHTISITVDPNTITETGVVHHHGN